MKLSWTEYRLELKKPFGIAGNSRTFTPVVFVRVEHEGVSGYGEASLPPYLPETPETVINFLKHLDLASQPFDANVIRQYIHSFPANNAAKAAVEIALLDLFSRHASRPAFKYLCRPSITPFNTYTIGIGELSDIKEKVQDAPDFHIIKVKLGCENDKAIINEIRKHTSKPLCVDVNQGWRTKEDALSMIEWLAGQDVILVEQPLLKTDIAGHAWLKERSPLPIYADESFQDINDLEKISHAFSGINIKLMKCGGPWKAIEIIEKADEKQLKVLIGSMNESSCANMAAAHISGGVDYSDLDGPFLINNNPFVDPVMADGRIILADKPGLGLEFTEAFINFPERFR